MYIFPVATDEQLPEDLLRHAARLSRWANRHAAMPLPWGRARVLSLVEELQPARVTTLADADDTSQPAMTAQVQRLHSDGLVTRETDPSDARAWLVSLTDDGARTLAEARRARGRALAPALAGTDEAALRGTVDLLARLVDATRAHPDDREDT